jgi:chorismate mutase
VTDIDHWRSEIDRVDLRLVELLNRRSQCAIEIVKVKKELNLGVYDPEREEEVIRLVQEATRGPLSKAAIKRLFERIIDESRRVEREHRNSG